MRKLIFVTFLLFCNACIFQNAKKEYGVKNDFLNVDLAKLVEYGQIANMAYEDRDEISKYYRKKYVKIIHQFETGNQAFIITDPLRKRQIIAISGTDNLQNVFFNTEFAKIYDDKIKADFYEGLYDVSKILYRKIGKNLKKNYQIIFLGHGTGGAVAVINALYAKKDNFQITDVITFGQPKIAALKDIDRLEKMIPLTRVVRSEDIVPFLPAINVNLSKREEIEDLASSKILWHFGSEVILYDDYFEFLEEYDAGRIDNSLLNIEGFKKRKSAHQMRQYLENLKDLEKELRNKTATDFKQYMVVY